MRSNVLKDDPLQLQLAVLRISVLAINVVLVG